MTRRKQERGIGTALLGPGYDLGLEEMLAAAAAQAIAPLGDDVEASRLACEASLSEFVRQAWPHVEPASPFMPNWHLDCICEHLQAMTLAQGAGRNLVINMPPRHGKSILVCVCWFAWTWAIRPESRWLYASYDHQLALRDGQKSLELIQSAWYQARWGGQFRLRQRKPAASKFTNNRSGHRLAVSVMGRGIGEGANFVIADDPHKPGDVRSDVLRERVLRWWAELMSTRGDDPRKVCRVVVMQRLHEMDLAGYLRQLGYDNLCMPAEYEPKRYFGTRLEACPDGKTMQRDAIVPTRLQQERPELQDPRREEGELLWPDRFGQAEVQELKRSLLAYGTAGQLQQRPAPEEGEIFKRSRFRYFVEETVQLGEEKVPCFVLHRPGGQEPLYIPKADCTWFQTCDTALKEAITSKYTAVQTAVMAPVYRDGGVAARFLLIYDVVRERLPVPEQYDFLVAQRDRYSDVAIQAVEPKASGIGLIQQAMAEGRPFHVLKCQGDKVQRAALVVTLYEAGLVYHRRGMPGLTDFEDELTTFPSGQYDDQVDCTSYSGVLFTQNRILGGTGEELLGAAAQAAPPGDTYQVGDREVFWPEDVREWWDR